jgi:hypothetical protein
MGAPSSQKIEQTTKTELDPVLQAHLYGGKVPDSAMTGIVPAYFRAPSGSLKGAYETVGELYGDQQRFADGGDVASGSDGGSNVLSLAEQAYQLTTGTDLGAQLPEYQVAGQDPAMTSAYNLGTGGIGSYQPYLQQGAATTQSGVGALQGALGTASSALQSAQPYQTAAAEMMNLGAETAMGATGSYDPSSYQSYMNPYTDEVIRASEQDAARQAAILGREIGASAVGAGAYGGGREAIARSEAARNIGDQLARTTSQLRQQGYMGAQQQAQTAFEQQQQRQLSGAGLAGQMGQGLGSLGTSYGQLGIQGAGQVGQLGQGLGNLGQQQAAFGQQAQQGLGADISMLQGLGQQQMQYDQATLDAERMNEYQRVMAPYQQTAFRADILSGSPTGVAGSMTQTSPGTSALSQIGGLAMAGLGSYYGSK